MDIVLSVESGVHGSGNFSNGIIILCVDKDRGANAVKR